MDTKNYRPVARLSGTLRGTTGSIGAQGLALTEQSYCCEAFLAPCVGLQSWDDSSPPPSLPPSFRGASQHFYSLSERVAP